jgi:hypothetical protein
MNSDFSEQTGGNTLLKDLVVPAGLFFLQQSITQKTHKYNEEDGDTVPASLYDRLLSLSDKNDERKTKKRGREKKPKRKTMKNN